MKHSSLNSMFNFYSRFGFQNVPGVSLFSTAAYPTYHRNTWKGALNVLYRRISRNGDRNGDRNGSIVPILDQWINEGRTAEKGDLLKIVKELRQYRRYRHALELSIWMSDKRYFELNNADVAIRLDLIAKVQGMEQAENYFNLIPKQLKVLEVYCALLNCYAKAKLVEKAEATKQSMRDLGFFRTSLAYNCLLILYYKTGNTVKFNTLMKEMEETGIGCDKYTYGIRLTAYAAASDLEGIDKVLAEWESNPECVVDWANYAIAANGYTKAGHAEKALEMLENSEKLISSSKRKREGYEYLMTQYGVLGKKDSVMRLWELYKKNMKVYNKGYMSIITSLLKIGDIESADMIYEEWESMDLSFDIRIPNFLIGAYSRKGHFDKAEAMIERILRKGNKPHSLSWYYLARGYLIHNQTGKAVELMRKALSAEGGIRLIPDKDSLTACLQYMKKKADFEGAEEFIRLLRDKHIISVSIQERLLDYINNDDSVSSEPGEMEWECLNGDTELQKQVDY